MNYFQPVLYTSCQVHRGGGKTLSGDKMSVKGDWNEDPAPALARHCRHQTSECHYTASRGPGTKRWVWPGRCHRPEDQPIIITQGTRPCLPCQQPLGTLRNVTHTINKGFCDPKLQIQNLLYHIQLIRWNTRLSHHTMMVPLNPKKVHIKLNFLL